MNVHASQYGLFPYHIFVRYIFLEYVCFHVILHLRKTTALRSVSTYKFNQNAQFKDAHEMAMQFLKEKLQ